MSPSSGAAPVVDMAAEGLQSFAAAFFQAAGPALTTALNRPVAVEILDVRSITVDELLEDLEAPWVFVELAYQRGLTGTHWLVLSRRDGLALAGDPGAGVVDLESRHKESIRTTVNQLLHASSASLLALAGRSVSYAPVTVHVTLRDEELPGDLVHQQRVWVVRARVVGDGHTIETALTVDEALAQAIAALGADAPEAAEGVVRGGGEAAPSKIDMILDVTLPVAVELGRARLQIQDILKLAPGSVIALDKSAGDPVELFINDRAIAKGEVVIIDENFGVRLTSIVTTSERIRTLR